MLRLLIRHCGRAGRQERMRTLRVSARRFASCMTGNGGHHFDPEVVARFRGRLSRKSLRSESRI